jgi:excisionase family DNA binding protein
MGVSIPTVVNWCDQGHLPAHRTPGGHRRIAHQDLVNLTRDRGVRWTGEASHGPARVLVVDDSREFSEMLRDVLRLHGFEVEVAGSGFQAGYTVARFVPDVIVMDIMMPDMDGFEAIRVIRQDSDTAHIPVVGCTAFLEPPIRARAEAEGFADILEKPVKMALLLERIRQVIAAGQHPT